MFLVRGQNLPSMIRADLWERSVPQRAGIQQLRSPGEYGIEGCFRLQNSIHKGTTSVPDIVHAGYRHVLYLVGAVGRYV